ncbi:MAG: DUF4340 domain-containing protein [Rhodospirillales bacterium]
MRSRTLAALSVVTVIAVAAAGLSVSREMSVREPGGVGQKMLPGLMDMLNGAGSIVVQGLGSKVTMVRTDDGWTIAERGGYPARAPKVRELILGMARLERIEAKTRLEKRYSRLNVEGPEKEGAKSKNITIFDENGGVLSELIVGKRRFTLEGQKGVYVRIPGDAQAWLAKGALNPGVTPTEWLRREIADIAAKRIAAVSIRHPGGQTLRLSKEAPEEEHFKVEDLAKGAKLKNAAAADEIAAALASLELDDVAPSSEVEFNADGVIRADFTTFDGLRASVMLSLNDGADWARLTFASDLGASQSGASQSGNGEEAGELNARTGGWAYRIPVYKASLFKKRLADLIQVEK